jgi:hypothetical protein
MAFGAGADHRGHDCADYWLRGRMKWSGASVCRGREPNQVTLQAPVRDRQAFGDGLFGEVSRRSLNQTACVPVTLFKL